VRLLVVGATGGLGRAVVGRALARGHDVTALVRDLDTAGLPGDVRCVGGNVLDRASLEPAVGGHDAVICALGTPSPRKATTLLEEGTAKLVEVMEHMGVPRLVCVTLLGVEGSRSNAGLLYRHVVLRVLGPMVPDKERQERVVRDSGLDWVLVRPPTFLGVHMRGRARVLREGERGRVGFVVRSRLADLLVHVAQCDDYVRQAIVAGH
jgi:uncharacterized protein YbjT (DUF2867 family)